MATGQVINECPSCGQKLRAGWLRCPRCRELAPEGPAEVADAAVPEPPSRLGWLAAGAAATIIVAVAGVVNSRLTDTATDRAGAAPAAGLANGPATIPGEPRPVDQALLARSKGEDERRAGYAAYATGDFESALGRFQAAVDANAEDPEARNNLGQLLVRHGRAADAVLHFDEAIRLDPQKWAYRFNRGRAYAEIEQYSQAIGDYRAAADMFPDDYATHYNLGLVYLRTKQYADAVESLERAVSLAPGDSTFLVSLGTAYVGVERPDKARATFEKFLEVAADDDPEVPRVKALIQALDAAKAGA